MNERTTDRYDVDRGRLLQKTCANKATNYAYFNNDGSAVFPFN